MKGEVLRLLKLRDEYVSGQELCELFGVSRTAVWKVINQLKEEGHLIDSVPNKGYSLKQEADGITKAEIKSNLTTQIMGNQIVYFDIIDSTNLRAKKMAEEGAKTGCLVVAKEQTNGRGRRGRGWISTPGSGIFMSLVLKPEISPMKASTLTLMTALCVTRGIEEVTGIRTQIKWPNDIVINGKKVCGILTEMSAELECIHYVIVGIGINANTESFDEELGRVATSLYLESGKNIKRSHLIASILKWMEFYYESFLKTEDLGMFIEEYNQQLVHYNQMVWIHQGQNVFSAMALGIDPSGALLIKKEDGSIFPVLSGEVSVRGLYGYV